MTTTLSPSKTATRWAIAAMVLSAASWGMGTVMSKYTLAQVPPITLLVVQLCASVAALWIGSLVVGKLPQWSQLRYGWTGVLEPGFAYLAGLIGLAHTSASSASLIGATEPFIVLVLAFFLLRERLSRWMLPIVVLGFVGTALVSFEQGTAGSTLSGDLIYFIGVAFAALYVVISRKSVAQVDPFPLAALQQSFGLGVALIALPIALTTGEAAQISSVPLSAWGIAALTGVVQYALAFIFYLTALKTLPASHAALFLTLIPIFGVGGSALFLGEQLTALQVVGAVLILGTLVILRISEKGQK